MAEPRLEIFARLIDPLPRLAMVDLGAGHCKFSLVAYRMGFPVTAVDGRNERVPADLPFPFLHQDARTTDLEPYGIVCILGLLYHLTLRDQIHLLRRCAGKIVIVDTETASKDAVCQGGYSGMMWQEMGGPKSSIGNPWSFWHTEESLQKLFTDCGFVAEKRETHAPGRAFWTLMTR